MANKNIISASTYDIYNKYLAIGEKYFGKDKDFLSYGAIGYWTELMASNMRDSAIHKMMLYNENFLNTAVMPKSVYNWAKMFNVNVTKAKPAKAYIKLKISEDDYESHAMKLSTSFSTLSTKYGSSVNGLDAYNVVVISKDNVIQAGEFSFMLEHSIFIFQTQTGVYRAKYCTSTGTLETPSTSYGDYTDEFIPVYVTTSEDGYTRYLELDAIAFQYKIVTHQKRIASSSFLDTRLHKFTFKDQIAEAFLSRVEGKITTNIDLLFSDMPVNESEYTSVAYYNLIDDDTIQIKFKGTSISPVPQSGSLLNLKIYETKGSKGNINYHEDIIMNSKDEDFKNLSIIISFNSSCTGGIDSASIEDIKNIIIRELSTRGTIISLADLNSYFAALSTQIKEVNNSNVTFVKKRDDIIKRTFTAYLLLRDGIMKIDSEGKPIYASGNYKSKVIPTNTVDLIYSMPSSTDVSSSFSINSNSNIYYDSSNNTFNYTGDNNSTLTSFTEDFIIPFEAHVYLTGYRQVKYYSTTTNNTMSLITYENNGDTDLYVTPLNINVFRPLSYNSVQPYIVSFRIKTNMQKENLELAHFYLGKSASSLLQTSKPEIEQESGENELEKIYILKFRLGYGNISFESSTNVSSLSLRLGESDQANNISVSENELLYLKIEHQPLNLDVVLRSYEKMNFFFSLGALMESDVVVKTDTSTNTSEITIKDVPLISKKYYETNSASVQEAFISQIYTYIKILKESLTKLENNTFIDIKFRNTYGLSKVYNSNKTNVRLKLNIYLKNVSNIDEELCKEIRDYIRVQVDLANNIGEISGSSANSGELNVSDIIATTIASYSNIIKRIDFVSLNGTFNQHIKPVINIEEHPEIVLEYFNLDTSNLENDILFFNE